MKTVKARTTAAMTRTILDDGGNTVKAGRLARRVFVCDYDTSASKPFTASTQQPKQRQRQKQRPRNPHCLEYRISLMLSSTPLMA